MRRRELLKYAAATTVVGSFGQRIARAADLPVIKFGVVGPKTGPLAPGAAVTHFPNFKLWAWLPRYLRWYFYAYGRRRPIDGFTPQPVFFAEESTS